MLAPWDGHGNQDRVSSAQHELAHVASCDGKRVRREPRCMRATPQPHGMRPKLLSDSKPPDNRQIPLRFNAAQIVQETAATADQREKSAPTRVVLRVRTHVLRQAIDPRCENGNLHFRRTRILFIVPEVLDNFLLPLFRDRHVLPSSLCCVRLALLTCHPPKPILLDPVSVRTVPTYYTINNLSDQCSDGSAFCNRKCEFPDRTCRRVPRNPPDWPLVTLSAATPSRSPGNLPSTSIRGPTAQPKFNPFSNLRI